MALVEIPSGINRRRFIATSALAGAGLVIARNLHAQAANVTSNRKPGDVVNVAMVGAGAQGQVLLQSLYDILAEGKIGVNLVAVCDIWKYNLQANVARSRNSGFKETKPYSDFDEMLEKEKGIDAVFVATPDFWHAPHTNQALKAGKHVYCEKMMARTADEARSMVRSMKDTGKLLQIGHQRRSSPNYRFAIEKLIREKKILGRITNASAQWNRAVSDDLVIPKGGEITQETLTKYGFENAHQFRNWRWFKKYSGGPISDLGAHQIDIFNWIFGRPRSVLAGGGVDYYKSHEWYDNVLCIFDYEGNGTDGHSVLGKGEVARAYYQVLTTTSSGGGYFENFMGDHGSLKLSEQPSHIKAYAEPNFEKIWKSEYVAEGLMTADESKPEPKADAALDTRASPPPPAFDLKNRVGTKKAHTFHVENFLKAINGEAKLTCDAAEAFEHEAPIYRVNDAVAEQKMIKYTDADFAV